MNSVSAPPPQPLLPDWKTPSENEQDRLLSRFIKFSLGLHVAVLVLLFLKGTLAPSEPKEYLPSLRVDLVGLPDRKVLDQANVKPLEKAPEEVKPAPVKPEPKVEIPAEKDSGDFSVAKKKAKEKKTSKKEIEAQKKLKNALARIKALERIKAMEGEPIRGNQISKGSAISGSAKVALETTYIDVVVERVRANWELPKWLQDQGLQAKVTLYIDRQGQLKRFEFTKSSGNEQFDSEVKRTLQVAAPFPVPPDAVAGDMTDGGISLGFPI
jgi:TonB family protein